MKRSIWMSSITAALLTAWLALAAAGAGAAEAPGSEPADRESGTAGPAAKDGEAPAKEQQNESGKPRTRKEGGIEVFVPSEEISEDFAVSFPVDI